MESKDAALAAVVREAEGATAVDRLYGPGSQHSAVGRQDVAAAIGKARAAGASDDEIRTAVAASAFRK